MPASRAAITVNSRASSSNDAGTVSTTSCSAIGRSGCASFHAPPSCARIFADISTGDITRPLSCASQGSIFAVRSASAFDSQLFAECTDRVGTSAPCSRAHSPITCFESARNRNDGSVRRASVRPSATNCGISSTLMGGKSASPASRGSM